MPEDINKQNVNTEIYSERNEATLTVSTMDIEEGLHEYRDVVSVRVRSKGYTILIMADHVPVIGDIFDGDVSILLANGEISFRKMRGFYQVNSNKMDLLVMSKEG